MKKIRSCCEARNREGEREERMRRLYSYLMDEKKIDEYRKAIENGEHGFAAV